VNYYISSRNVRQQVNELNGMEKQCSKTMRKKFKYGNGWNCTLAFGTFVFSDTILTYNICKIPNLRIVQEVLRLIMSAIPAVSVCTLRIWCCRLPVCSYFKARNEIILYFTRTGPEMLTFVCEDGKKDIFFVYYNTFLYHCSQCWNHYEISNSYHTLLTV